jgi:protease PrsW
VATTSLIRALLSVPGHALFSAMWGYALGFAKFSDPPLAKKLIRRGLLLSIGLHALFNLLCLSGPSFALGMLVFVPIAWKSVNRKIHAALAASPYTRISETQDERE